MKGLRGAQSGQIREPGSWSTSAPATTTGAMRTVWIATASSFKVDTNATAALPASPPRATPREIAGTILSASLPGRPPGRQFYAWWGNNRVRSVDFVARARLSSVNHGGRGHAGEQGAVDR